MKVKTIDITAKEWFDRINGNSYFSAIIKLNYGMETEQTFYIPFQYGYDNHYITEASKLLKEKNVINIKENEPLWQYCESNSIILRTVKIPNCTKKEVINFVN